MSRRRAATEGRPYSFNPERARPRKSAAITSVSSSKLKSGRGSPDGTEMYLLSALSSTMELNARSRARSTSDKYSSIRSGVERVSGRVHSKGSSQRFAVSPPKVCSITAALRRRFSEGTDLTSSFRLLINSANSRSRWLTMSRLIEVLSPARAPVSLFHHRSIAATTERKSVMDVAFCSDARTA